MGLDPRMRRVLLESIIDDIADTGTAVIWATSRVDEIELMADTVGILHQGRMLLSGDLTDLCDSVRTFRCYSDAPAPDLSDLPGLLHVKSFPDEQVVTVRDFDEITVAALRARGVNRIEINNR